MTYPTKAEMLTQGVELARKFCNLNGLRAPAVREVKTLDWGFGVCAYYRKNETSICVAKCAAIGLAGMAWSYPGYTVDRTPYGVIAHELGHHVDWHFGGRKGPYFGDFSVGMRTRTKEPPISSYCPDDAEWFAEIFRVFVTNPDLLRELRPKAYAELASLFTPVFSDTWAERLSNAPARTIEAARRKVAGVA